MRSKEDGKLVAVKMMKVKKAGVGIETLRKEATTLAMLQHPHIVRYFASCSFKKGKVFAIVMELLTGGSLLDRMRKNPGAKEVGRWVGEVAAALAHMHSLRVQHRDVKPDNVLLDSTGSAKLIDVGLAATLNSKSRVSTRAGGMVGTTLYMSPEKGSGKSYDGKDDVWALGLILAGGAIGTPLEDMGLNTKGIFALNRAGVDTLVQKAKVVSAAFGSLVHSMLKNAPTQRPTAREVASHLLSDEGDEESKVGVGLSADLLAPPPSWELMDDPLELRMCELPESSQEYTEAVRRFRATLPPSVVVLSVARVQNLPLWQSFAVKRHATLMRKRNGRHAAAHLERECLFHGTDEVAAPSICYIGFNRSFNGKNATVYGKGCYFARDASYSYRPTYSRPDASGVQRMFLARVVVGEPQPAPGRDNQIVPDVIPGSNLRYDSTVGLFGSDTVADASIYVTYHDGQAYPEYLIKFKEVQQV